MVSPYLIFDRQGNGVDINMHDKTKSCHGCPDRVADPNCHGTCKGYIDRAAASGSTSYGEHSGAGRADCDSDSANTDSDEIGGTHARL